MIFTYSIWEKFCKTLAEQGKHSITAETVLESGSTEHYLVLKHDVETDVSSALRIAEIEHKHGHCGSYYVQGYLLEKKENVELLKKLQALGHEVSYHHDVMDCCKGDVEKALIEFDRNRAVFEKSGFAIKTVCQHGNPVIERVGYTSNRDFFRSQRVQEWIGIIADIMVDFKRKANTDYVYFSDAGRRFNLIYDPINDDLIRSEEKNVPFEDLDSLRGYMEENPDKNFIISIHPHRWVASKVKCILKNTAFKVIRFVARNLAKIPIFKKIMSRYYYLAKKI